MDELSGIRDEHNDLHADIQDGGADLVDKENDTSNCFYDYYNMKPNLHCFSQLINNMSESLNTNSRIIHIDALMEMWMMEAGRLSDR